MQDFEGKRKSIYKGILFFGILILLFAVVSAKSERALLNNDWLVPARNRNSYRILREPEESIDIIVIGDSLSYSAISPLTLWKEQGYTSYVCGQSSQTIRETEEMLAMALERQTPSLIILETDVLFRGPVGVKSLNDSIEALLNYYIPVFRGHDAWKSVIVDKTEHAEDNYKGFAYRCTVKPYSKGEFMVKTKEKEPLSDTVLTHMENIITLCQSHGAELVLLSTPSPVCYNYARHNALSEYAKEQKLTYLDLNLNTKAVGIDWQTDSFDQGDHLNLSGAVKVTKYLGSFLSESYSLTDHRGEAAYVSWEKESIIYEEKKEKDLAAMRRKDT